MCLAIPGKVLSVEGIIGEVDFMGTRRRVRLDLVDARVGDWVIVHVGTAIEVIDEQSASETIKLFEDYLL
jgi:hydrogenase expression/formation protein HypC